MGCFHSTLALSSNPGNQHTELRSPFTCSDGEAAAVAATGSSHPNAPRTQQPDSNILLTVRDLFDPNSNVDVDLQNSSGPKKSNNQQSTSQQQPGRGSSRQQHSSRSTSLLPHHLTSASRAPTGAQHQADVGFDSEDFHIELDAEDDDPNLSSELNRCTSGFRFPTDVGSQSLAGQPTHRNTLNGGDSPQTSPSATPSIRYNNGANPEMAATATPTPALTGAGAPRPRAHDSFEGSSGSSQRLMDTVVPLIMMSSVDMQGGHMGGGVDTPNRAGPSVTAAGGVVATPVARGSKHHQQQHPQQQELQLPQQNPLSRLPLPSGAAAAAAGVPVDGLASCDSSCGNVAGGGISARRPTLTRGFTRDSFLLGATTTTGGGGGSGFMMRTATAREGVLLGADAAWPPFHMGNPLQLSIGELLGRGGCGSVYRGEWRGRPVAVKVVQQIVPLPPAPAAAAAAAAATGAAPPPLITPLVDYFGSSNGLAVHDPGASTLTSSTTHNIGNININNNNLYDNPGRRPVMPSSRDTAASPAVPHLPDAHASVKGLRHPNVLRTYAYAVLSVPPQLDGVVPARHEHHVILELCDGGTLRAWLDRLFQLGLEAAKRCGPEGGSGGMCTAGRGNVAAGGQYSTVQEQRRQGPGQVTEIMTKPWQQPKEVEVCGEGAGAEGRQVTGMRPALDSARGAELGTTTSTAPQASIAEAEGSRGVMYDRLVAAGASRTCPAAGIDAGGAVDGMTAIGTPSGPLSRPLRGLTPAESQRLQSLGRAWLSDTLLGDDGGGGGSRNRMACGYSTAAGCGGAAGRADDGDDDSRDAEMATGVVMGSYDEAADGSASYIDDDGASSSGLRAAADCGDVPGGFCRADAADGSYGGGGHMGLTGAEAVMTSQRASEAGAAGIHSPGRPSLEAVRLSPSPPPAALAASWAGAAPAELEVPSSAPMMQAMPYNAGFGNGSLGSRGDRGGASIMAHGYLDSESTVQFSATGVVQQHYVILSDDEFEEEQAERATTGNTGRFVITPPGSGSVPVADRIRHNHMYGGRSAGGGYGGGSGRLQFGGMRMDEPLQQLEEVSEEGQQSCRSRGDASSSAAVTSALFNSSLITAATNTTAAAGGGGGDAASGGAGADSRSRRMFVSYVSGGSGGGACGSSQPTGTETLEQQQSLLLPIGQVLPSSPPPPTTTISGATSAASAAAALLRHLGLPACREPSLLGPVVPYRTNGSLATVASAPPPAPSAAAGEFAPATALLNRRAMSVVNSILKAAAAANGTGGGGGGGAFAVSGGVSAMTTASAGVPASEAVTPGQLRHLLTALEVLAEVAAGLCYLHSIGMVHGDVKSGNVLLKMNPDLPLGFQVKLADFGFSRVLEHGSHTYLSRPTGTLAYLSPELLTSHRLSTAADMYAFGLMVWEVVTTQPLFRGLQTAQVLYAKTHHADWTHLHWPAWCPPEARTLARRCSEYQPAARLSAQQAHGQLTALRAKYTKQQQQQ